MTMHHFDTITTHTSDFPPRYSFLGTAEEAEAIPATHKDQIFFLNQEASQFIRAYLDASHMVTWRAWEPFNPRYFSSVQSISLDDDRLDDDRLDVKKWLYEKPIPFSKQVYLCGAQGQAVALTWKMVIKYWTGICRGSDVVIFDESLNWCLFYFHEDHLFWGSDKVYDPDYEAEKAKDRNALQQKYFHKDSAGIDAAEKQQAIRAYLEKYGTDRVE